MKISKATVIEFRIFLNELQDTFPFKKDGTVRSNLSYKNKMKIGDFYIEFIYHIVESYIRKVNRQTELIDVTKIWIPHTLLEKLNTMLSSVNPMWVFNTPEDMNRYVGDCRGKFIVIYEDNVIIPKIKERN